MIYKHHIQMVKNQTPFSWMHRPRHKLITCGIIYGPNLSENADRSEQFILVIANLLI